MVSYNRLLKAMSSQVCISARMEISQSLSTTCSILKSPAKYIFFPPYAEVEFHMFQFLSIDACSITEHNREESISILFSSQVFVHIGKIPPESSVLQAKKITAPSSSHHIMGALALSSIIFAALHWTPVCPCLSHHGEPRTGANTQVWPHQG